MRSILRLYLVCTTLCLGMAHAAILYVNTAATGPTHDGTTWAKAYLTVQNAIDHANSTDEIHVAKGVYSEHVALHDDIHLLGGFAGSGPTPDQRDIHGNATILDGSASGGSVVTMDSTVGAALLEGFTIEGGSGSDGNGGGIHISECSPTIQSNTIAQNKAGTDGGGIWVSNGSPTITRNTVIGNTSNHFGGGIYVGNSGAKVANNTIARNTSGYGGALFEENAGGPTVVNNTITENYASYAPSGALYAREDFAFANNIIAFNSGGVQFDAANTLSNHNLFFGNTAGDNFGTATASATDVHADPQIARSQFGDYHIQPTSPARNAGSNAAVVGTTDIDGDARIQQGTVDIGADESNGTATFTPVAVIFYVRPDGNDAGDGHSWATARQTIQSAINDATILGGEVWVKQGTYTGHLDLGFSVALYGGFVGTETARSQRQDPRLHPSILDGTGATNSVISVPIATSATAVIDGFTIQHGTGATDGSGGGIHITNSNVVVRNNIVQLNSATGGAGIYAGGGAPTITNCTVIGNTAANLGGGIYLSGAAAAVANCTLARNSASFGGGLFQESSSGVTVVNNTFAENFAVNSDSGAMYTRDDVVFVNNLVAFNSGGVHYDAVNTHSNNNLYFRNVVANYAGIAVPQTGDVVADPLFVRDQYGNYHIQPTSPARNAGSNAAVIGTTDIDGEARVQQGIVDIGSDETNGTATNAPVEAVEYVTTSGADTNNGTTWATAKKTVAAALNALTVGGEVWVEAGTYTEGGINLATGKSVYGGFVGTETTRAQRPDPSLHPSILDGHSAGTSVIIAPPGVAASTVLDGFTIENGSGSPDGNGAGIHLTDADPIIRNNTVTQNSASTNGGGISVTRGAPSIYSNVITLNFDNTFGGGIYLQNCGGVVANNVIALNNGQFGGAIFEENNSSTAITGNTIADNTAQNPDSGAAYIRDDLPLANNIIAFNSGGLHMEAPTTKSRYNLYFQNAAGDYAGVATAGPSDLNGVDPLFVNHNAADYHIQTGSPAVDTGEDASAFGSFDVRRGKRIVGAHMDRGAYELQADLGVTAIVNNPTPTTGTNVTYTLTVANHGPDPATTVRLSDTLPSNLNGVVLISAGGGTAAGTGNSRTITFPTLASGASATVTIQATVDCSVPNNTVIGNTATVTTVAPPTVPTPDQDTTNNSATASLTASNPVAVITPPANKVVSNDTGLCSAVVTYAAATVTDNCPGVNLVYSAPSGSTFAKGVTTVTITATDAGGGVSTSSFTVTVNDTEKPKVTAPADKVVSSDAGGCTASAVNLGNATATDNCDTVTASGVRSDGQALTAPYPKGVTTITWSATDHSGNTGTATQTVTVNDTQAPVISSPSVTPAVLLKADHRLVTVTVNYTAGDNCDLSPTTTLTATSNEADSGTGTGDVAGDIVVVDNHHIQLRAERAGLSQPRLYTITIKAQDSSGNVTTQAVTVTVPAPALADIKNALRIAGGLTAATATDLTHLDVEPNGKIDLADAVRLAREVAGLEP